MYSISYFLYFNKTRIINIQVDPHLCFSGVVLQILHNYVSSCLEKGTKSC